MNDEVLALIIFITLIALVILVIIISIINEKIIKIVKENSQQYNNLIKLNNKHIFNQNIYQCYYINKDYATKVQYDKSQTSNVLYDELYGNIDDYSKLINEVEHNRKTYKIYDEEYNNLTSNITIEDVKKCKLSYKKFIKIEKKLYQKNKVKPILSFKVRVKTEYTSPQGRNHYEYQETYDYEYVYNKFNQVSNDIEQSKKHEEIVRKERLKLTASMRYDVLNRDGGRCQICGATQVDGVKLHVDHIIPVSKGGKTEMSNLRTLCDKCNLGKSDKM